MAEYGGMAASDEGGVKYVLQDWQGSTRAIVGNTGYVTSRSDYTAFGENIGTGMGLRTSQQGFGVSDSLRQRYGLTERDDATGLDHTWFRKNEHQAGRWTSPDPYNGSMSLGNPQSFNRYSYVENDPANYVDPSGLNAVYYVCYDVNDRGPSDPDNPVVPGRTTTVCWFFPSSGGSSPWDTPDPTGGDDFPSAGGGDEPLPFNTCEEFVGFLINVSMSTYKNANGNKAATVKSLGAGLMDLAYSGYQRHINNGFAGFKDVLVVPGSQGAGVYGHILGMAGAQLYGAVGVAIGTANSIIDRAQNLWGKADGQGPAEVAGNLAGTAVGNILWNWIGSRQKGTNKSMYDLEQKLKEEMCK